MVFGDRVSDIEMQFLHVPSAEVCGVIRQITFHGSCSILTAGSGANIYILIGDAINHERICSEISVVVSLE